MNDAINWNASRQNSDLNADFEDKKIIIHEKCIPINYSENMREKEVKEKLLIKKDENGKRFFYISMGRFQDAFVWNAFFFQKSSDNFSWT